MSLAEATTVDLSPWTDRLHRRAAAARQPAAPGPVVRLLFGIFWWLFEVARTLLFLAVVAVVVFVVVLAAREAAVNLIGWGWR